MGSFMLSTKSTAPFTFWLETTAGAKQKVHDLSEDAM
jgi:hypothetical protein